MISVILAALIFSPGTGCSVFVVQAENTNKHVTINATIFILSFAHNERSNAAEEEIGGRLARFLQAD